MRLKGGLPAALLLAGLLLAGVRSSDAQATPAPQGDAGGQPGNAAPASKRGWQCASLRPQDDEVVTTKGQPVTMPLTYLLGNDLTGTSLSLDELSVSSVFSTERRGLRRSAVTASLSRSSVTFTPRASFVGSVRFTYTVAHAKCCSGLGSRTGCSATVTVTVNEPDIGGGSGSKFLQVCNQDSDLGDIYLGASWKADKGDNDKTPAGSIGISSAGWGWDKPISFGDCVRLSLPDTVNAGRVWVRTGCKTALPARCKADSKGWPTCNIPQRSVYCDALGRTTPDGACRDQGADWFTGQTWCSWDGMCTVADWPEDLVIPACTTPPKACTDQCGSGQFLCDNVPPGTQGIPVCQCTGGGTVPPKDAFTTMYQTTLCKGQPSLMCYKSTNAYTVPAPPTLTGTTKFRCDTGDCGSQKCAGPGTASPIPGTLFEYTGPLGTVVDTSKPVPDSYDISVVDGYNVAVKLSVINPDNKYKNRCARSPCFTDPTNADKSGYQNPATITCTPTFEGCVDELKIQPGGKTIGCYSLCKAMSNPSHQSMVQGTDARKKLQELVKGVVPDTKNPWVNLACCTCGGGKSCPSDLNQFCNQTDASTSSGFLGSCTNSPQRCEYGCSPSSNMGVQNPTSPGCDYRKWPLASDGNPYWQHTRQSCQYGYFWQYGECLMPSADTSGAFESDYKTPLHNSCGDAATSAEGQGFRLDVAAATAAGAGKLNRL